MFAQRKRHVVDVLRQVPVTLPSGEVTGYTWSTLFANLPAEVLTGPGREFNAADAKQTETSARINLDWFPGLLSDMKIVWEGKSFDILSIETDVTARLEYRLRCKEGTNDGA